MSIFWLWQFRIVMKLETISLSIQLASLSAMFSGASSEKAMFSSPKAAMFLTQTPLIGSCLEFELFCGPPEKYQN